MRIQLPAKSPASSLPVQEYPRQLDPPLLSGSGAHDSCGMYRSKRPDFDGTPDREPGRLGERLAR